ncbi:glycosyltransferase family 39 protein [Spirulina sp. CS-785/01]|uniref:glycosyltransferase family 39 protein n=1 Tax=Spirulina sp. CS-785/01 TaxID=3021716 RepID=UPI0023302423|nr:glycosyltransferase family 39 protein [Spirulina sp. CS-785/01]MDB9315491.1 glycosyltransferase family 39 protein [Spirulina sp. CS-785/01]
MHYFLLCGILFLGTILRFLQLERKPLWIDEVITALFSLGQGFDAVPLEQVIPVQDVPEIFTLNPNSSCGEISHFLATQSTHPPLFFCLLHRWLVMLQGVDLSLAWQLRAFPAMVGVGAIAALYLLNRIAYSRKAGLLGAAVMAVSPFAVYLSQEARHYTLPILLITLSLCCLVKIEQNLRGNNLNLSHNLWLWGVWGLLSVLSLYTHYFCLLAISAQVLTLTIVIITQKTLKNQLIHWQFLVNLILGLILFTLPFLLFIPWINSFWTHFTSNKTDWLPSPSFINPPLQTIAGWTTMVITPPVESQPFWVQVPLILLTLGFIFWLVSRCRRSFKQLFKMPTKKDNLGIKTLFYFTLLVLLEFLAVVYILNKDITVAPRYHFIYYPGICALLGILFSIPLTPKKCSNVPLNSHQHQRSIEPSPIVQSLQQRLPLNSPFWLYGVGVLSSLCVVFNLAFQKPYYPTKVAQQFQATPPPVVVVMAYQNTLEIAVGLSYALAFAEIQQQPAQFTLLRTNDGYENVWNSLSQFNIAPRSLWAIAPGYILKSYPPTIPLKNRNTCNIDLSEHHRIGFPYQLYRCTIEE